MTNELEPLEGESPDAFAQRAQEGTVGEEPKAPETVKVGDKEYTPDTLATLIADAERAREIEKGGREKFEKAAELEKSIAAEKERLADMETVWNSWTKGTPEEKKLILQALQAEITGQMNESELTENEAALKRSFEAQSAHQNAIIQQLQAKLDAIAPVLEDVKAWTGSKREAEKMQSDIATIKEKTGIDVSAETLQSWKDNGITDPVKAALGVMLPMLQSVQTVKEKAPNEVPDATLTNTFDPDDPNIGPDEMARMLARGMQPIR